MSWFSAMRAKLARVFPGLRPRNWDGFRAIDDIKEDSEDQKEFNRKNNHV